MALRLKRHDVQAATIADRPSQRPEVPHEQLRAPEKIQGAQPGEAQISPGVLDHQVDLRARERERGGGGGWGGGQSAHVQYPLNDADHIQTNTHTHTQPTQHTYTAYTTYTIHPYIHRPATAGSSCSCATGAPPPYASRSPATWRPCRCRGRGRR